MSKSIKYLTTVISVTLGLRLFSMSIIIPFLSAYAMNLKGGSPALTGYALGIFGLTQAVLQIPFGVLSDRIGYKKVMLAGLVMLIAGLLTAAYATSIGWLIFARALQGSGAIVTVGYSWLSSVSGDAERDKILTKLGALLATFTMLSYVLGPLVHIVLNVSQMFVFSAILIVGCFIWVLTSTKQVNPALRKEYAQKHKVKSVFNISHLSKSLILTFNNFLMMAFFFMLPLLLEGNLATNQIWIVLSPSILIAVGVLPYFSKQASKANAKKVLTVLFLLIAVGFFSIYFRTVVSVICGTILLMVGLLSISSIVPMLINREMDNRQRGKGNGVMVSLQYFGSFLGAAVTGKLWGWGLVVAFGFVGAVIFAGIILTNLESKPSNLPLEIETKYETQPQPASKRRYKP
ncbi:MFS transporter [Maribellus sp. YY47]|uniref:MFS transporter n=1 Tax=Maribellus sp. YY47 TaxID=2929486 RepID=UPI002000A9A6|nr:MFS transporter [Maribellus sp. YY47]MCK3683964.1 MFS transporter [Maribellus sp. YY47]